MHIGKAVYAAFLFHVGGAKDHEGVKLPSLAAAKTAAARYAGELLCETADHFWDTGEVTMIVADQEGLGLFSLGLARNDWHVRSCLT